jgi:hypothetical protein
VGVGVSGKGEGGANGGGAAKPGFAFLIDHSLTGVRRRWSLNKLCPFAQRGNSGQSSESPTQEREAEMTPIRGLTIHTYGFLSLSLGDGISR